MFKNSSIQENISYVSFFISIYALTALPFSGLILSAIYFIYITFFIVFLVVVWDFNSISNLKIGKLSIDKLLLITIFFVMLLNVFFFNRQNNSDIKSVSKVFSYFPVFFIFAIYLPGVFFKNTYKFEAFLNFLIIFGVINTLFGWFALFAGLQQNVTYPGFLMGLFNHPNASGFVYSLTIPILVYKFIYRRYNRIVFSVMIFVFTLSLLFTFSRAAYIATGVSILILSYYKSKRAFLIMVGIIVILIFTIIVDFTASKGGLSSISRLLLFATAYDMIIADPFHFMWGYGVVNFYDTFLSEKLFLGSLEIVADPHNFILLLGVQFGMIITSLIVFYMIVTLLKSAKSMKRIPSNKS